MANTIIIYQGDGTTTSFTVPFDYLKKTFVKVFLNSVTELTGGTSTDTSADYYFADNSTIKLRSLVPSTTQTITIRRYTSVTERVASFRDGSVLYAKDLDVSQVQAFHIAEEARDLLNDSLTVNKQGYWDARNTRIVNVGTPTDATDAVTKEYVDTTVGLMKTLGEYESTTKGYRDEAEVFKNQAKEYASGASNSATRAETAKSATDTNLATVQTLAGEVAEDRKEVERILADVDQILIEQGTGCYEVQWVTSEAIPAGTEISIPSTVGYIVGRHHLKVYYNGLVCYLGRNFNEVGTVDNKSTKFTLTFNVKAGDELCVWISALGKSDVADAITKAQTALDSVAELSQKVVYKDESSASS